MALLQPSKQPLLIAIKPCPIRAPALNPRSDNFFIAFSHLTGLSHDPAISLYTPTHTHPSPTINFGPVQSPTQPLDPGHQLHNLSISLTLAKAENVPAIARLLPFPPYPGPYGHLTLTPMVLTHPHGYHLCPVQFSGPSTEGGDPHTVLSTPLHSLTL